MKTEVWAWLQDNYFSIAQPTAQNSAGLYPLILACQQGRSDVVRFLLAEQADLSVVDDYGNNALWAACYAQNGECIAALLQAGIDPDYQSPASGATALMFAASSGREAVVEQLIQGGADPTLKNHDDFTAVDLASTRKILKFLSPLVKPGA
ncbi:ankyrin repeat domain-containing protein [Methylovulum psychrotolerans]|jgi:ankyrin repeat protein|uniref:Uncharacterized protein n=1 Tax=Methylovulum psychrotolerans TaxID=1704499 RepID=A0A1Z4BWS6_9GAMM|nr:ankyrin repeat domain-containing protein [Methylovulum psychrotolerans]ASF45735.1 hypothetical protein CEK71_06430 [Methylovulum psychrotolerans]